MKSYISGDFTDGIGSIDRLRAWLKEGGNTAWLFSLESTPTKDLKNSNTQNTLHCCFKACFEEHLVKKSNSYQNLSCGLFPFYLVMTSI